MEKLLHEKLKEFELSHGSYEKGTLDHRRYMVRDITGQEAGCLADEIERYYIPRPRFEDGEVIENGKPFLADNCKEDTIRHTNVEENGFWHIYGDWYMAEGEAGEFVKRPIPKVYDADGVVYKRGETVFNVETGDEHIVESLDECAVKVKGDDTWWCNDCFTHERPVFDAEDVRICKGDTVWLKNTKLKGIVTTVYSDDRTVVEVNVLNCLTDCRPSELTHREPDSLEKLRDALVDVAVRYREDGLSLCDEVDDCAKRLTALIERGA